MDGMEWQRTKYSSTVKRFLKFAERLAIKNSDYYVADSPVIKEYLDMKYNINSRYIAYGAELNPHPDEQWLGHFGVNKNEYFMLMARMEPENNIEMVLDGFCSSGSGKIFLVVGNIENKFGKYLAKKYKAVPQIIFTGAIYEKDKIQSLIAFCGLYFHGHSVGGTNPSLLDTMALQAPIAAHHNAFNKSVLKQNAVFFSDARDVGNLISAGQYYNLQYILNNYEYVKMESGWNKIINKYEQLFIECYLAKYGKSTITAKTPTLY